MNASRLGFDPHLGWIVLSVFVLAALLVWGFYAFRGGRAWLTRALAISIIAVALSNPLWVNLMLGGPFILTGLLFWLSYLKLLLSNWNQSHLKL